MEKMDYKKSEKSLYRPKAEPAEILVPELPFLQIDGKGNPNQPDGEYAQAVGLLYTLSYTIKMSKLGESVPSGYFEYVVPPLEGLWEFGEGGFVKKDFYWTAMIRQPEFVTEEVYRWACDEVKKKKPQEGKVLEALLEQAKIRLQTYEEGLCVQMMHLGPYDDEPENLAKMEACVENAGLRNAIGSQDKNGIIRRHHEIYLANPRKSKPEKLKTILRIPVERINHD